jgi:L-alanine-DL-glutamate epimerase-like enolase superfamily enzyme
MKICSFEAVSVDLPLREGYRIANQTIAFVRNALVRVESDEGLIGLGGAAPANDEGGESDESCLAALNGPLRELALGSEVSPDPSPLADRAHRLAADSPAARAALDTALWDLAARKAGVPTETAAHLGNDRRVRCRGNARSRTRLDRAGISHPQGEDR